MASPSIKTEHGLLAYPTAATGNLAVSVRTDGKVAQADTHDLTTASSPAFTGMTLASSLTWQQGLGVINHVRAPGDEILRITSISSGTQADYSGVGNKGGIYITASSAAGNNLGGGWVVISSGSGTLGNPSYSSGGNVLIKTPDADAYDWTIGSINLTAGSKTTDGVYAGGSPGGISLTTGSCNIERGNPNGIAGGAMQFTTGKGTTVSPGVSGETTVGGAGGLFSFTGGAGGDATGNGGVHTGGAGASVTITSGAGGNASGTGGTHTGGNSGNITLNTGTPGTGTTANGTAGSLLVQAGNVVITNGSISLRNGGTAATFSPNILQVHGFWADASNYVRAAITCNTTVTGGTYVQLASETAGTGEDDVDVILSPAGNGAFYLGPPADGTAVGGNARGNRAIDLQFGRYFASNVASGGSSVAIGYSCEAGGSYSIAIGKYARSYGFCSIALGEVAYAAGTGSIAIGNTCSCNAGASVCVGYESTANGDNSMALGYHAQANNAGQYAYAAGGGAGLYQFIRYVLRGKTITDTAVELVTGPYLTYAKVSSGRAVSGTLNIQGVTLDGATVAHYTGTFSIKNVGGTTTLNSAVLTCASGMDGGTTVDVTANNTGDYLSVKVAGLLPTGELTGCTIAASNDKITKSAHGLTYGTPVIFTSLSGGTGLTADTVVYYVFDVTENDFRVTASYMGSAVDITVDYTDATVARPSIMRWTCSVDAVETVYGF